MIANFCQSLSALLLVSLASAQEVEFKERYACAVCHELIAGRGTCERFGACHRLDVSSLSAKGSCDEFCPKPSAALSQTSAGPELRIAKGFGTKGYTQIRVSVISNSSIAPVPGFFDYSKQFKYKWTTNYLHTAMKSITPGEIVKLNVGVEVSFKLPKQGDGVAGVLIADPCVSGSYVGCLFEKKYKTSERTPGLINTFVTDQSTDFWGIYGDNWYDRTGELTARVFDQISLEAKTKVFTTVAGNHDYWVLGDPDLSSTLDQCANGHMQYYAQDTKAAENVSIGSGDDPFDFSVDPNAKRPFGLGCNLPKITNAFWYNQIGNIGLVGQSGAYSLNETKPLMQEACQWLGQQAGLDVVVLFGHWDVSGLGASDDMAMPSWYTEMAALPGCTEFDRRGMLKFVMGHTHCNDPHPHGKVDVGFRVAGFGMEDVCDANSSYGMPIVDTTEDRVRFWYFDTSSDSLYDNVTSCVQKKGWRQCTEYAIKWLDQPIAKASTEFTI